MKKEQTFSIVKYDDGGIEIYAGDVIERSKIHYDKYIVLNKEILEYAAANKTCIHYIESGLKHIRIDAKPRFDFQELLINRDIPQTVDGDSVLDYIPTTQQ